MPRGSFVPAGFQYRSHSSIEAHGIHWVHEEIVTDKLYIETKKLRPIGGMYYESTVPSDVRPGKEHFSRECTAIYLIILFIVLVRFFRSFEINVLEMHGIILSPKFPFY